MNRRLLTGLGALGAAAFWIIAPAAQAPKKADWLTDGADPQRTAWQRNETILNKDNVKDMKLLWKIKLDNQTRQMHSLFPPLIAGSVATAGGPKEIAIVAGVSDNLYAVDVDTGTLLWHKHFDSTYQEPTPGGGRGGGSTLCPGGLTATPVLDRTSPGKYIAYVVSWDGRLRKLDVATGEEIEPPALFVPPNGKPYGLNLVNGVIYTSTAQGCGGNPNNFYSYDLATKKVGNWAPGSGGLWPRTGPSVGKDGTVYAGSGDGDYIPAQQIYGQAMIGVKQNPQTKALELKDWYAQSIAVCMRKRDLDFDASSPILDYKG
jgi:outer membrane protein assembly factor BamB